jgi:hypothetical protein
MKRFWILITTFSLVEWIGRNPATAGFLMLLGIGGGVGGIATLITPTITPVPAAYFNQNQAFGETNNGLSLNAGTAGPMAFPASDTTGSLTTYFEAMVDSNLSYSQSFQTLIGGVGLYTNTNPGQPTFFLGRQLGGQGAAQWWLSAPAFTQSTLNESGGSNYFSGLYAATATGGGCSVQPSIVWFGGATRVQVTAPGIGCGGTTTGPTVNTAAIPGSGARQATGTAASPPQTGTTCSVVNGQAVVTANLAVAHGVTPGLQYAMASFTTTPANVLNTTFTALQGTTGSTLVGTPTTLLATCPTISSEGTALSGTGATITFPTLSTTAPWTTVGMTGVTTKTGQHICGMIGENGDDSAFPGSAYVAMVDASGTALPGSPSLITGSLNLGTANFTGYTLANTQTTGTQALVVTAMNPYVISAASWALGSGALASTGVVTFTTTTNPGFVPGSEFVVSGMSPSSVNGTYVAVKPTSGTTVVGNQLTGPGGTLSPLSNPGAITTASTPQMISVILPGMRVLGTSSFSTAAISPYGTFGGTGTGGVGTYGLTTNQTAGGTFTVSGASSLQITVTGSPTQTIVVGTTFTLNSNTYVIASLGSGTGGAGTYNVASGSPAAGTATTTGVIGSSGAPVTLFAAPGFYYAAAASSTPAGGTVTSNTTFTLGGDFWGPLVGGASTGGAVTNQGWGGAIGNLAALYGPAPMQAGGAPSTTALASLCTKTTTVPGFAAANGMTVHSFYPLSDIGVYGDAGVAQVSGYITATTGATTGVLNLVGSPITGALTGSGTAVLSGPGIPGCTVPATPACPTVTLGAGPTYAVTWASGIGKNVGSSGTPIAMSAGTYKPAIPNGSVNVNGYIDSAGGGGTLPTLHVTAYPTAGSAFFTGELSSQVTGTISGSVLTVTSVTSGALSIGVGTIINSAPGAATSFGPLTVTSLGTGVGLTGTYNLSGSATVSTAESILGTGILPSGPTWLTATGVTSVMAPGMVVTDGGVNLTAQPLLINTGSGQNWIVASNYYQPIAAESMTATLSSIVPGEYLYNSGLQTPVKVIGYQGACGIAGAMNGGLGCYTLSTGANGNVASSGSPTTFVGTTITDGGAIAPGPALTIKDQGPDATFPVDLATVACTGFGACTATGTLHLSGTYNTGSLGGTPSGIQVLVSNSAGGPALSGCTPCNWGALTATISGGAWSGTISGIPPGGPYSVSIRATNGTVYATLPSTVRIGLAFDAYGQGQIAALFTGQSGVNLSYFSGLWGQTVAHSAFANNEQYLTGPPVASNFVPAQSQSTAGDRFGINGNSNGGVISEAIGTFEQLLANAFGWPQSVADIVHDGVGNLLMSQGNVSQTQTIGVGNGSTLTWCSASVYCSNASAAGPLYFTANAITGATVVGASVSGTTLTVPSNGVTLGALSPNMVLSGSGISGAPTLMNCLTGCTIASFNSHAAQTWTVSATFTAPSSMRADFASGEPAVNFNYQTGGLPFGLGGYGAPIIKAGTFQITNATTGAVLCQDSVVFAYNLSGGNCNGAGVASAFVNYQTGDYQVTFSSGNAPASGNALVASWTNIISPETVTSLSLSHPQNIDYFGDGTAQSGLVSSVLNKYPGGVSGHINSGCSTDEGYILQGAAGTINQGYQFGAPGYSRMTSWLYGTKFTNIPGMSAATPQIVSLQYRGEGGGFPVNSNNLGKLNTCDQWGQDFSTQSAFTGTIASSVLTLSAAAVGPMWEGEVIGPGAGNTGLTSPTGIYITSLASGAWGASGSTYNLAGASGVTDTGAMINDVYYTGSGPAIYAGTNNDINVQNTGSAGAGGYYAHMWAGWTGGRRVAARLAATIWGALTSTPVAGVPPANASPPSVDRVKADAGGCDANAIGSPCFDIGNTYAASATPTAASGSTLTFNGLVAHARPVVVGQAVTCSGCTTNLVVTAVDHPPTQDTRAGQGQIGSLNNGFVVTLNAASGWTSGAVTFGCSGTSGVGANCIDIAFSVNTTAETFGTAAAIATCGANNVNGNAENYQPAGGKCQDNGVGEIVRAFRIGTAQSMIWGTAGSVFDDGMDFYGGAFNQNAAFTCNIVAARVIQCVKAPTYNTSTGAFTSIGQWASGSTFVNYGDMSEVSGRLGAVVGNVGGQYFASGMTAGSGYTPGRYTNISGSCTLTSNSAGAGAGVNAKLDVTVGSGGGITGYYPSNTGSAMGNGIVGTCTVPVTSIPGGSGGAITVPIIPTEGEGGIATYSTDLNTMGMFLYDNTGFVGNPLNSFFTNGQGGYFEPGLPVRPFGEFQGLAVSG